MGCSYLGLFEKWEIGVATHLIRKFQRRWICLHQESFEDLLQECLSHWHFSKTSYDPQGEASQKTFMARIIVNKLIDLVRGREAQKRKTTCPAISIDEDSACAIEALNRGLIGNVPFDPFEQIELQLDLSRVLKKLTPQQQQLCHLLGVGGMNVKEASACLKVSRASLYDQIKRIRTAFEKESLGDYLKKTSDTF